MTNGHLQQMIQQNKNAKFNISFYYFSLPRM